ncbi:MAG: adenylate/guanylate cyclase domain-containing protein, partial [Firmicutes bacterium]|nr:adenylate/guanylate cyclase domain-containing protein [Bacillota bacterium]
MTQQEMQQLKKAEEEILQLKEELKQKDAFIRRTLGQYLTDEVATEILQHREHPEIRGERRTVTMMFTDLRRSTQLSEEMDPVDFIHMLNHYFGEMIEIINAWQGNILEFVGDAIVAVFGAPRPNE